MPTPATDSDDNPSTTPLSLILHHSPSPQPPPVPIPLLHPLPSPISRRLAISWSRGNTLRVSLFRHQDTPPPPPSADGDGGVGGSVVELRLGTGTGIGDGDGAKWRRIQYGSAQQFGVLQNRKGAVMAESELSMMPMADFEWTEYAMEYSKEISSLLGDVNQIPPLAIDDPRKILKDVEEPTGLKAAWELLEIFYSDNLSQTWLPERLVDWLADFDCVLSQTQATIHSKLVDLQNELVHFRAVEDYPKYWEGISSALAVGWLDIAVKLLRLHGSYQLDQMGDRELENGLVEAVAILTSKMPRLRPELRAGKLGNCFNNKPEFNAAREKWRGQLTKLECSGFWVQCGHKQTSEGLRNLIRIMLGDTVSLSDSTCDWVELYISQLLYVRPFTVGLEGMYSLAQKCVQLKPVSRAHGLLRLMIGILGENTEVVLAECSKEFGPWMTVHAIELLTAGSNQSGIILQEERHNLGGLSIEELHRIVYAQVLASHPLTWQLAPIYLAPCTKLGVGFLEILLYRQPVQHSRGLLKTLEFCRLYDIDSVKSKLMKIAGIYHWKNGRKGSAIFWLQQAQDHVRLNKIAQQLFDVVGKSVSSESFKQWEGLIELLGSDSKTSGGLDFLRKYRDFKKSLQQVHDGKAIDAAKKAVESLIKLMKNPSTPQHFWLPLLYDSVKLLSWSDGPLLDVSQTNLLLNKLQELSLARLRPDFVEADLPPEALSSVRLALATNLGRAYLEE